MQWKDKMFLSLLLSIPPSSGRSVFVLLSPTAGLDSGFASVFAQFPGIVGNGGPAVLVYCGWIQTVRLL